MYAASGKSMIAASVGERVTLRAKDLLTAAGMKSESLRVSPGNAAGSMETSRCGSKRIAAGRRGRCEMGIVSCESFPIRRCAITAYDYAARLDLQCCCGHYDKNTAR
jgi:hypothetical protein